MKISIIRGVIKKLRESGLEVLSVMDLHQGENNNFVLSEAQENEYVLITNDKDFGDLVIRQKLLHRGVILLRLPSHNRHHSSNSGFVRRSDAQPIYCVW